MRQEIKESTSSVIKGLAIDDDIVRAVEIRQYYHMNIKNTLILEIVSTVLPIQSDR